MTTFGPIDDQVNRFDAAVESFAENLRGNRVVDATMYAISESANHSILWHLINTADAIGAGADSPRRNRALRRSAILAIEQAAVNGPIKAAFNRDRPTAPEAHPHDLRTPLTSSFPSGHASAGFAAAHLLSRDYGAAPAWYALAALVSWSRIHVGVHHPSDIVGGAIAGSTLARIAGRVWK
jgi:undecaprenyl-diphosphatase